MALLEILLFIIQVQFLEGGTLVVTFWYFWWEVEFGHRKNWYRSRTLFINTYIHITLLPCGVGRANRKLYASILTYIPCFILVHYSNQILRLFDGVVLTLLWGSHNRGSFLLQKEVYVSVTSNSQSRRLPARGLIKTDNSEKTIGTIRKSAKLKFDQPLLYVKVIRWNDSSIKITLNEEERQKYRVSEVGSINKVIDGRVETNES